MRFDKKTKHKFLDLKVHREPYARLRHALASKNLIHLTGSKNCGKSTLVERVVQDLKEEGPIFIKIRCDTFIDPTKGLREIRASLAKTYDDDHLQNKHSTIKDIAQMKQYMRDYELALIQRSSIENKSIIFIFDQADALMKCHFMNFFECLRAIQDELRYQTTLRFLLISRSPNFFNSILDKRSRAGLKCEAYHISMTSWSKEDFVELLKQQLPRTQEDDYIKELTNFSILAFGKHSNYANQPQAMIQDVRKKFREYLQVKIKDENNATKRASRFQIEHHANRNLIRSGRNMQVSYLAVNKMKISAYIASKTTTDDDKSNFVLLSNRSLRTRRSHKANDVGHFTQERLCKIDQSLGNKIDGRVRKGENHHNEPENIDESLKHEKYLSDQHAITKSGDILDGDSKLKLSDYYSQSHIIKLANGLNLELSELTGFASK